MNTSAVANLLGVSQSTVKRWVKQLRLQLDRNEFGHFTYTKEDITILKNFQENVQFGYPQTNTISTTEPRKAVIKTISDPLLENIFNKLMLLETRLDRKADSVVSYQLLQHRKEIEELENQIKQLSFRIEELENEKRYSVKVNQPLVLDTTTKSINRKKKKNIITTLFGF